MKFYTTVKSVTKEKRLVRSRKDPADPAGKATIEEWEDLGWFVAFEGSWEKVRCGTGKLPDEDFRVGQRVGVTIVPE